MAEANNNPLGPIIGVFAKLSIQQKMLLGGIVVVTIVLLAFVLFVFNEPTLTPLYTNLTEEDASKVVSELSSRKVQYKITDNGTAIHVPKDQIYELRLALAAEGIPNSGVIGYEIFDKNTMGMSEFMQKLNLKRALEGELSRTIMTQAGIENARVHIVVPEKSVFRDEQKDPTASVVLQYNKSVGLSNRNIEAISNLVASSVEGLEAERVTIIDTRGRLLSKQYEEDELSMSGGKQYEMKGNVETYLARKSQAILDNVLGYGNSIVKVNVELDFKQVERTMRTVDPESQVAISEQLVNSENIGNGASDSTVSITGNTLTNYELSNTVERVIEGAGNLKRITVAAVVNGVPVQIEEGEETRTVFEPRDDAQLQKLETILRQAVGIDPSRNDELSVVSIPFETQAIEPEIIEEKLPLGDISEWSNFLLIFVAIGASLVVLKTLMKRLKNEKIMIGTMNYNDQSFDDLSAPLPAGPGMQMQPAMGGAAGGAAAQIGGGATPAPQIQSGRKKQALSIGDLEDEITDEAMSKKARSEKITNYVQKNPTDAAKLINSWLREDEY